MAAQQWMRRFIFSKNPDRTWKQWRQKAWPNVVEYTAYIGQLLCFYHLFTEYVGEATLCIGPSMLPTFRIVGDLVIVENFTPRFRPVELGDVIVARSPLNPTQFICKRIAGLPGDLVCVDPSSSDSKTTIIPPGHVWLQGDNFNNSTDSRTYGAVPLGLIKGRVIARIFPFRDFKIIDKNVTQVIQ